MYRIRGFKTIIYHLIILESVIILHHLAFFKLMGFLNIELS